MKRLVGIVVGVGVIAVGVGMAYMYWSQRDLAGQTASSPSMVSDSALRGLPQKDESGIDTSHVGAGVIPPTNKWFSGLALQKKPQKVFPTPLSVIPTDNSFTYDFPGVTTSAAAIMASSRHPVKVEVSGATGYVVTRYDEVSVDLTFQNGEKKLGTLTLVAGLPYLYYHGVSDSTLKLDDGGTVSGNSITYGSKDIVLGAAAFDGALVDNHLIKVPSGGLVTLYAGTEAMTSDLESHAANRVESTNVSYQKDGDTYRTTITYKTANGQPTYYGRLPHQNGGSEGRGTETIYGTLSMETGTELRFTTPFVALTDSLDLSKLSSADRDVLAQTVRQEINTPHAYPDDSYFGAKALYRDAQLLQLANQLGEKEAASAIMTQLSGGLSAWLTRDDTGARSFYYDSKIQGIVGVTPSFGSEEFNDHHFHYAYFIYAASILARYDTTFVADHKDTVNLLVADIANYRSDEKLPLRRAFDPYFGHSWASGSAPFADGNNQESSSEAINAWVATALWAGLTDNPALSDQSAWMLSSEAAATSSYWLNFNRSELPYSAGFGHSVVSLNWGGKRDYATFFSADARAMLGIQLIPMNPTMQYMSKYGSRIPEQLKEAQGDTPAQFDDYLLMYEALNKKSDTLERAKQLPDNLIDNANSRSYMYAWIMSRE